MHLNVNLGYLGHFRHALFSFCFNANWRPVDSSVTWKQLCKVEEAILQAQSYAANLGPQDEFTSFICPPRTAQQIYSCLHVMDVWGLKTGFHLFDSMLFLDYSIFLAAYGRHIPTMVSRKLSVLCVCMPECKALHDSSRIPKKNHDNHSPHRCRSHLYVGQHMNSSTATDRPCVI